MKIRSMDIADYEEVYALWMASENFGENNRLDINEI